MNDARNISSIIWGFADMLYPAVERADYHRIILPLTLIRRFDFYIADKIPLLQERLAELRAEFSEEHMNDHKFIQEELADILVDEYGTPLKVYNLSGKSFQSLVDIADSIEGDKTIVDAFQDYINKFSPNVREILDSFEVMAQIKKLQQKNKLAPLLRNFNNAKGLSPEFLSNNAMGVLYEDLIRKWADSIKAEAGEFFTPRDIVKALAELVFAGGKEFVRRGQVIRSYDPTCGSGGLLTVADEDEKNEDGSIKSVSMAQKYFPGVEHQLYGQELKELPYAICKADMLLKGKNDENIKHGNTLENDMHEGTTFNFMLANPPYGASWESSRKQIEAEHQRGLNGRFPAGLPRSSDSSMLFIQHLIAKMDPMGSRVGIVLAGSPLFNGDAGSGESEIRRYILENDLLETLVALPTDLFFDTGIGTYLWILTNKKEAKRKGKVQLIDAREVFTKMRKAIGDKRKELSDEDRETILSCWEKFEDCPISKIFDNSHFGYRKITIERPLKQLYRVDSESLDELKSSMANLAEKSRTKKVPDTAMEQFAVDVLNASATWKDMSWPTEAKALAGIKELCAGLGYTPTNAMLKEVLKPITRAAHTDEDRQVAELILDAKGKPKADPALRDTECVPLGVDVSAYFKNDVAPFAQDAWLDSGKRDARDSLIGVIGFEINPNNEFFCKSICRPASEIQGEINELLLSIVKNMTT